MATPSPPSSTSSASSSSRSPTSESGSSSSPEKPRVSGCDPVWNVRFDTKVIKDAFDAIGTKEAWKRQVSEDPSLARVHDDLTAPPDGNVFVYCLLPTNTQRSADGMIFSFFPSVEEDRWQRVRHRYPNADFTRIARLRLKLGVPTRSVTSSAGTSTSAAERYRAEFLGWSDDDRREACETECRHMIWRNGSGWSTEFRVICSEGLADILEFSAVSILLPDPVAHALRRPIVFSRYLNGTESNKSNVPNLLAKSELGAFMTSFDLERIPWTTESQIRAILPLARMTLVPSLDTQVPVVTAVAPPPPASVGAGAGARTGTGGAGARGLSMTSPYVSASYGDVLPPPPTTWKPVPVAPSPSPPSPSSPPTPSSPTSSVTYPSSWAESKKLHEFVSGVPVPSRLVTGTSPGGTGSASGGAAAGAVATSREQEQAIRLENLRRIQSQFGFGYRF